MPQSASGPPLVRAIGIRMAFGGVEVVKGVDLELFPGEVHAIVGENGAGKSTMAKVVAGVHRPVGGRLEYQGEAVEFSGPLQALERGIALIHQEPLSFPDLSVAESIFVGHQPQVGPLGRVDWATMRRTATKILSELGVSIDPDARVGVLTVADQQMVELASALSQNAQVLLMDETTASLTPKEAAELFVIVRRLREEGRAVAFVSHHLDQIFELADRITVLRDGEKVAERLTAETTPAEIVRLMVGRDVPVRVSTRTAPQGPAILRVAALTQPGRFQDIGFEVRAGEVVGLAGLVGAGRTDVCQSIFGIRPPTSGEVWVGGRQVRIRNPRQAMELGLAMVPEDRQHEGLHLPMSLSENATLASLRQIVGNWLRPAKEATASESLLNRLHTAFRSVGQPVQELSGGNQQKVVLAKWLMTEPRLLILDEPTRGVDIGAKDEIHRLIEELVADGLAILMVSSDLPELLALSDRVLVMHEGAITKEFSRAEATSELVMWAATGQDQSDLAGRGVH